MTLRLSQVNRHECSARTLVLQAMFHQSLINCVTSYYGHVYFFFITHVVYYHIGYTMYMLTCAICAVTMILEVYTHMAIIVSKSSSPYTLSSQLYGYYQPRHHNHRYTVKYSHSIWLGLPTRNQMSKYEDQNRP